MRKNALLNAAAAVAFANPAPKATRAPADHTPPTIVGAFKFDMDALPSRKGNRRGSTSAYPFDTLTEIGAAFGVKDKTVKQLASVVNNQNRRNVKPVLDDAGNPTFAMMKLEQPGGGSIEVPNAKKPITKAEKRFAAYDASLPEVAALIKGTPLAGSTAIVVREL